MSNWIKTSADMQRHIDLSNEAIAWWQFDHPGEPVNITAAHEFYSLRLGKTKDYLRLDNRTNPIRVIKEISNSGAICPWCGLNLKFKVLSLCPKANPRGYSSMFYCGSEDDEEGDCIYVAYVLDGLLDVRRHLIENRFDLIKLVEAKYG